MARDKKATLPITTRATNEWGIPDWRDVAAYGNWKSWSYMRWRWEFYRRRDDLRAAFDACAEQTYRAMAAHYPPWPDGSMGRVLQPHQPGFVARLYCDEAKKFGYTGLPNPRISAQPARVIFAALDYPGNNRMMLGKGSRYPGIPEHEIGIGDGEMAVVFDLDKPIGPQLEQLNDTLRGWQIERHGKALQTRSQKEKWFGYLRTLDAEDAGASWRVISELHPHKAQTSQSGRDAYAAANALRFNF